MSDCVPEDIVEQILHRLPPKSLGKCMAVCKSWKLLIRKIVLSAPLFLIQRSSPYEYSLCSPNIQYSFSLPHDSQYDFVGALNGLVCFHDFNARIRIVLFNPLTRRVFQLPTSQILVSNFYRNFEFRFGFCFDSKKNDFKVLNMCYPDEIGVHPVVELYSVNEGAWRVINDSSSLVQPSINLSDPELSLYRIEHCGQQLFYQGNVHWLACKTILYRDQEQPSTIYYILIFNVLEEKFNQMVLPDVLANSSGWLRLEITVIDGCLSLIEYLTDSSCNIWMKRESWSIIQSVSLSGGNFQQLLGQNTSSQVLVLPSSLRPPRWSYRETVSLHSYDLKSQELRDLGVKSRFTRLCASDFTYNLIFLDKESIGEVWDHQDDESSLCAVWDQSSRKRRQRPLKMKRQKLIDGGYNRGFQL